MLWPSWPRAPRPVDTWAPNSHRPAVARSFPHRFHPLPSPSAQPQQIRDRPQQFPALSAQFYSLSAARRGSASKSQKHVLAFQPLPRPASY